MQEGEFLVMSAPPGSDSAQTRLLPTVVGSLAPGDSQELEREVIALFDEYRGRLLAYILAFGVAGHDGEELLQEVFLSLFCHLRMGKSRKNLRGWIFRVAHNLALKQRQANRRWRDQLDPDECTEQQRDPDPNPEEQMLSAQRQRRLLSVVCALPEQDQLCLRLRAEGLRYREITHVLGISLGAVSISLTRSIARLTRSDKM
jgi:RNA polymerase sigma-70 factor (ECF subfamily)